MAQMNRGEIRTELMSRGFEGFVAADLNRYINWGYFHVARTARWNWEKVIATFNIAPGVFSHPFSSLTVGVGSVEKLMVTTTDYEDDLDPMTSEEFFEDWLPKDLTLSKFRSEPSKYYVDQEAIYILPPPLATRGFKITYWGTVTELTADSGAGSTPATPQEYEEAIVIAAEIRCHVRAKEFDMAQARRADLDEIFNDLLVRDSFRWDEQIERVIPDNRWV